MTSRTGERPGAPARQPRRRPPDVRREQILDAAERVLVERGLATTTMADVAGAAAVAKGTVYLYFESKAGLRARCGPATSSASRPGWASFPTRRGPAPPPPGSIAGGRLVRLRPGQPCPAPRAV